MFTIVGGFIGNLVLDASKDYVKEHPAGTDFA
jgi:hypothetical protein